MQAKALWCYQWSYLDLYSCKLGGGGICPTDPFTSAEAELLPVPNIVVPGAQKNGVYIGRAVSLAPSANSTK